MNVFTESCEYNPHRKGIPKSFQIEPPPIVDTIWTIDANQLKSLFKGSTPSYIENCPQSHAKSVFFIFSSSYRCFIASLWDSEAGCKHSVSQIQSFFG